MARKVLSNEPALTTQNEATQLSSILSVFVAPDFRDINQFSIGDLRALIANKVLFAKAGVPGNVDRIAGLSRIGLDTDAGVIYVSVAGAAFVKVGGESGTDVNEVNQLIAAAVADFISSDVINSRIANAIADFISGTEVNKRIADAGTGLTPEQAQVLARVGEIYIRDFRQDKPGAPQPNAPQSDIDAAYKTIGIGNDGVLWVYELIPAHDSEGTWIDFDNANYEFEQTERLPNSALEDGDFYYIYTREEWISVSVNQQTGVVTQAVVDDISTILPNHVFLGNASSEDSATHLIDNYDSNKTYLAFFNREVYQLESYIAGAVGVGRWIQSTETLYNEVLRIESRLNSIESKASDLQTEIDSQQNQITQHAQDIFDNRKAAQRFPVTPVGNWRRDTGTGTLVAGDYQANEDTILIHKTDADGTDQETALSTIHLNHAINIHSKFFVVLGVTGYATYSEFSGYWTKAGEDTTANDAKILIRYVAKNNRLGEWVRAEDIVGLSAGNVTQASVYAELKKIIKRGSNVTVTFDDDNDSITLASSGGGGGGSSFNILAGDGPPASSLGNDGDFYREKDDGTVWRKVSGNWVEVIDLATEDELAVVRVALQALETEVTALESEIRSVLYRTPRRVTSMPAHVEQFEMIVLTEDSHGGEDVYDFVPDEATYNQGGEYYNYWGANVINFGAKLPLIGSGFPSIFRGNRLVAIYQVRRTTGTSELQKLKVVVRTGVFNATSLTDQETKLSVRLPQYGDALYRLRASTFDDTGTATRVVAGQSYSVYETIENFPNSAFSVAAQNLNKASIQISQEISGIRQFLSDDNTTVWATGIEYTAGLYQGNASRKPVEVEIVPKDTIKELKAEIASAGSASVSDADIDTADPSQESTTVAPSRQAVAEEIKRVEDSIPEGGGGITTEENRFERLQADVAATTNIRFRVADQAGLPTIDNFPRRQGTSWEIDYRQVAGKLIVFDPNASANTTFEINLQDLVGIRTELIGTDLDGTVFLFANKSDKTGSFTANPAIAQVFPTGQTLPAGGLALITINSIGANGPSQTYELLIQPLGGGSGEDDKEVLYGPGVPSAALGEIGDSYVRTSNGVEYKKTGSATWTQQIDNATQAELDAKVTDAAINILSPSAESTTVAGSRQSVAEMGKNLKDAADAAKSAADAAQVTADAAGAGESPRRVSSLPTSGYKLGDMVYLTAKDGSNDIGLYQVFNTSDGYERAVVNREPRVLLSWSETRGYADVTLPANYTDYSFLFMVTVSSNMEFGFHNIPINALQDSRRDDARAGIGDIGGSSTERVKFNRTTRVFSRHSESIESFSYLELR